MYHAHRTKKFEKSLIKLYRSGKLSKSIISDIEYIIDTLKEGKILPKKFKDHSLLGNLRSYKECHIRHDLLLVYEILEEELVLVLMDIGPHSYVFN
ncbi:MAG: mRNA interferase YafQ [Candidatus Paceibacteria bacterium]|jgi:mRNA interferase YafQ